MFTLVPDIWDYTSSYCEDSGLGGGWGFPGLLKDKTSYLLTSLFIAVRCFSRMDSSALCWPLVSIES